MAQIQPKQSFVRRSRRFFSRWQLVLLLLPALVYMLLFHYWPMYGVQIAFREYSARKGFWGSDWVGLKHFANFFNYPFFWQIVRNTVNISLYALLAGFPFPILIALFLNEVRHKRYKKTVQMVVFMPHFISIVALCGMVTLFLDRNNGLFNAVRAALGQERLPFLSVGDYFKSIYVWSGVWQHTGFASIIYLAALSAVDPNLIEAAIIDGANRYQIIWHINFQSIKPVIMTQLILKIGQLMNVGFEKVLLLQNNLNMQYSDVISTYVYRNGLGGAQFSYTAAIGLFNNVINLMLLLMVNYLAKRYSGNAI